MYLSLLVIGAVLTGAGCVSIGFGIPNHAFGLGNTLIISGTVAVAGGLILIGLAAVVRQLQRVAEGAQRPASRSARGYEPSEAVPVPPTARMTPVPAASPLGRPPQPRQADLNAPRAAEPRRPEPRHAEPRHPEPRFPGAAAPSEGPGPLDWLRPKSRSSSASEPPVVEIPDEVPLSPRGAPRPALPLSDLPEPSQLPKAPWQSGRGGEDADEPKSDFKFPQRSDVGARATPASERKSPREPDVFDRIFSENRGARSEPQETERDDKQDALRSREEPSAERRDEPAAERRGEQPAERRSPASAAERPSAILKSGVIDGMAYTLFADGSIEAELPQGTVKFNSVDALRAHLEKHG